MGEIMSPVPRRQAWLNRLSKETDSNSSLDFDYDSLSRFDQDWVLLNSELATQAASVLQTKLGENSWV